MKLEEIIENIESEDKAIASVHAECSYRFVDMVLSKERNIETETAKKVLEVLEKLARINKEAKDAKKLIAA